MNGIKCLSRELEPAAVYCVHPVMGKDKKQKPDEQDCVIEARAPEKKVFDLVQGHDTSPMAYSAYCAESRSGFGLSELPGALRVDGIGYDTVAVQLQAEIGPLESTVGLKTNLPAGREITVLGEARNIEGLLWLYTLELRPT